MLSDKKVKKVTTNYMYQIGTLIPIGEEKFEIVDCEKDKYLCTNHCGEQAILSEEQIQTFIKQHEQ